MIIKRCFDILVSLIGLILFLPVMLIVAVMIWLSMGSPIFFIQKRPGYKGMPFDIVKFRTMRMSDPGKSSVEDDGERLTHLGRILRKTSIDELPEF